MNFRTSFLLIVLLTPLILPAQTQEDSSLIYFYRPGLGGFLVGFNLYNEDSVVARIRASSLAVVKSIPGRQKFWAETETKSSTFLNVEPGKVYFVRIRMSMGALVGVPLFRQVSGQKAVPEIKSIYTGRKEPPSRHEMFTLDSLYKLPATLHPQDTLMGLNNLFARKRAGLRARTVLFCILIFPPFGSFFVIAAAQGSKYKDAKLQAAVIEYEEHGTMPKKIKSKFKPKDFRW